MQRRTLLTTTGSIVTTTILAGCGDSTDDDDYEGGDGENYDDADGNGGGNGGGNEADDSEGTEEPAARILDHELVVEEGEYPEEDWDDDVMVTGTVLNQSGDLLDYVEVKVRVFNADGQQLDTYSDATRDLKAESEWPFEVGLYDRTEDEVAEYEIAIDWAQY